MSRHARISQGIRKAVLTPEELPSREDAPPDFSYGPDHLAKYFQTKDGVSYEVVFVLVTRTDAPEGTWSMGFDPVTERESENKFEVIQNVVAALREFIQEKDPSGLYYAATSPSRERLYQALFKRLLPDSPVQNFTDIGRYIPLAEELKGEHPQPGYAPSALRSSSHRVAVFVGDPGYSLWITPGGSTYRVKVDHLYDMESGDMNALLPPGLRAEGDEAIGELLNLGWIRVSGKNIEIAKWDDKIRRNLESLVEKEPNRLGLNIDLRSPSGRKWARITKEDYEADDFHINPIFHSHR